MARISDQIDDIHNINRGKYIGSLFVFIVEFAINSGYHVFVVGERYIKSARFNPLIVLANVRSACYIFQYQHIDVPMA